MNDDVRIKRNNYNVHEHVVSPPPPPNVRNNVKSIGMRNGSKTKQFALLRRRKCPKCEVWLPIVDFIADPRLRRLCNHCRKARAKELIALRKWKAK